MLVREELLVAKMVLTKLMNRLHMAAEDDNLGFEELGLISARCACLRSALDVIEDAEFAWQGQLDEDDPVCVN